MSKTHQNYLSNRVLKLNVGFLLADGPAHSHDSQIDFPSVKVDDDLTLNYIRGPLRLSRTKEGILVQAKFEVSLDDSCYRCLEAIDHVIHVELEELYAADRYNAEAEFFITEDAVLDLAPLLRAETIIEQGYYKPCRLDVQGNCGICHKQFNQKDDENDLDKIDPRLAILKQLLDN